jgi:pimeloyl-ACP methyl ester carboxylesterase
MAEASANGVRHHVQRIGKGSPVVLFVHGLVMDNLSSFYFTLANPVASFAEVVLYDLRGHGLSERPKAGYALSDFEADLARLIEALQLSTPLHLVGNSFGGLLALSYALAHPENVASLVLIDSHLGSPGWGEAMAATLSLSGDERDARIAQDFQRWLGRHSERKRTRLADHAKALIEGTSLVDDLRHSPPLGPDALRHLDLPVLALYGEQSDLKAHAQRLPELLPRAKLLVRAGCSHSLLWEATGWVREQLMAWLVEHR